MIPIGMSIVVAGLVAVLGIGPAEAQSTNKRGRGALDFLVNSVWLEMTPGQHETRSMMTFLSNGTLIQGSCVTPYTLSSWHPLGPRTITWEDGAVPISADIISISSVELVLEIGSDKSQHIYLPATLPAACPPTPK